MSNSVYLLTTLFHNAKERVERRSSGPIEEDVNLETLSCNRQKRQQPNDLDSSARLRLRAAGDQETVNIDVLDPSEQDTINVDSGSDAFLNLDEEEFPEGGLQASLTLLGSFFGLLTCFGIPNSISAVEAYIAHHQLENVSASVVGWVFSILMATCTFFGIFTGHVFDTKGPRIPLVGGTILTFAGVFATANCTKVYQFILAFGLLTGTGLAVQTPALLGVIAQYYNRKRGTMMAVATVGGSVGGSVFPVMLRALYSAVGFQWAMRIFAFVAGTFDVAAVLLVKPRLPPRTLVHSEGMDGSAGKRALEMATTALDVKAFKDPRFTLCAFGTMFAETFLFAGMTYYGSYSISKGNSENTSYMLITLVNVAGIFSRLLAGIAADKLGRFNVNITMVAVAAITCLALWLPLGKYIGGLYAFTVTFGMFSAGVVSLGPSCLSQISRVDEFGKRYSTTNVVVALGLLIGIPVCGLFIGSNPTAKTYDNYIVFVSMVGIAAALCFLAARYYAVGTRLCIY